VVVPGADFDRRHRMTSSPASIAAGRRRLATITEDEQEQSKPEDFLMSLRIFGAQRRPNPKKEAKALTLALCH
jgi:hypothetical protein